MNDYDMVKQAFNQIQAEEALKSSTRRFLAQKTKGYTKAAKQQYHIYAAACACLLFLLVGGRWLYFTPTSAISIDINPSLELGVNRFDRIISVEGLNADGREFAKGLDIKYKNYADAMDQILENKSITALLSNDEIMTITITGLNEIQSAEILSEIETCTAGQRNTYCYFSSPSEAAAAHEAGLSYGKYRAFLELQILDPDITPEAIQNMTMRELRDLIDRLSVDHENETSSDSDREYGGHGSGSGHRNRQRNRKDSE